MVKRNILEKMSTNELEKYIRLESPFVPEAIEIAYSILKSRGVIFSDSDDIRIKGLIKVKKEEDLELIKSNTWDINAVMECSNLELYSQKSIWYFSIVFGIHLGAILLAVNLFNTSQKGKAWLVILFGITYSIFLYIMYTFSRIYVPDYCILLLILMTGCGAAILQFYFWDKYLVAIKYKKKSIAMPLVICMIIYSLILLGMVF